MKTLATMVSVEQRSIPEGERMPLGALLEPAEVCNIVSNSPLAGDRVALSCRILRI